MEENRPETRDPEQSPEGGTEPPLASDGASPKGPGNKGSREKIKIRFRVKNERSGAKSRKKAKAPSGISYSSGKDSTFSKGNTFILVALLIFGGCVLMAYLVLSRLGAPPAMPSD